ncbi:MAG TPA: type IV pilin N-terminal domain-containing protein [Candidatus Bathyarchaeia archaeon]|nr:type IV pilin N-terminal domain-containing protein [Candidatus Bathyarchaeia archaeon]
MIQKIRKDKKGVSPVIGVILMVAATIVIAAVVIAMLGGFTAPSKSYAVMATARMGSIGGSPTIYVTYMGGPDAGQVDTLDATITDGATGTPLIDTAWTGGGPGHTAVVPSVDWALPDGSADVKVGSGGYNSLAGYTPAPNDDHVVVTATFVDGTAQVILETWL